MNGNYSGATTATGPKRVKNFGPLSAFGNLNWFSTRSESVLQLATFKSYNFGYISVQFGNLLSL